MSFILDKNKIKESLTESDIQLILRDLGSTSIKKDVHGNLITQTICHNIFGGSEKLYYYKEIYAFRCYTDCGCTFDIFDLVMKAKRKKGFIYSFTQVISYVANLTGKMYMNNPFLSHKKVDYLIDDWDWINKYKKEKKPNIELPTYSHTVFEVFRLIFHQDWIEEGISVQSMLKYGIRYYIKEDRVVIPHFNHKGGLVGIRGRAMRQEDIDAGKKYMPLTVDGQLYNHPTAFNLYGLYQNKQAISRYKKIILFEGEKSVLKCDTLYKEDCFAVATAGSSVSNYQRDLILSLGVESVTLAFDKEFENADSEEAKNYAKKIRKICEKFVLYCRVFVLWDTSNLLEFKDSPIDKGREVFEQLMKNKIEVYSKKIIEEVYN